MVFYAYKVHIENMYFCRSINAEKKIWERTNPSDNNAYWGVRDWAVCYHLLVGERHAQKLQLIIN